MKIISKCFLVASFLFPAMLFGQTAKEKKLAIAVAELTKAMEDADSTQLYKITSPKLSYGHSGGHVEGQEEFVRKITSGKSDFVKITIENQTISLERKTGIVRQNFNATTNDNGKPGEVHLKILLVWIYKNGQWKMLARQAVKSAS